jgi:glycosyltransferase involved in cell wall biosynthesis
MTSVVDNEYILYLRRYGIIGLMCYLSFFLAPWILAVRVLWRFGKNKAAESSRGSPLPTSLLPAAAYAVVLPSVFVFNIMAGIFYNLQVMTFFLVFFGLVYNSLIVSGGKDQGESKSESKNTEDFEEHGDLKILVISHMYPTCANPVAGIFVQGQTHALVDARVEAVVINPIPWVPIFLWWHPRWRGYAQIPRVEKDRGITVLHPRYLEFPKGFLFASMADRYYWGVNATVDKLLEEWRPDIIQAHVAFPDGVAAARFREKYGIPVVVTIHGMDFFITMRRGLACKRGVKQALIKADRVVLVSEALKENFGIEEWINDIEKCRVIYNGARVGNVLSSQTPNEAVEESQADAKRGTPLLLTVGFLNKPKGHAYVLRALPDLLKNFPKLVYRIVGDGSERSELERLVEELEIQAHVAFLGELRHEEAMCEMAACDIMVMPSWNEGFGVVYLEAMAHGKPVIGTQGEGAAKLIEREKVGLTVPAQDAAAITHAVYEILSNRELAQAMGQRGREVVAAQFTWSHNAEQMLNLYNEMLEDS